MAAGYSDGTLRLFSIPLIAMELKMHPHSAALTAIAFSADGEAGLTVTARLLPGPGHTFGLRARGSRVTAWSLPRPGQTILSGDRDGLVAVSRPRTGMTFRVLNDHRGAPICTIQSTRREVK